MKIFNHQHKLTHSYWWTKHHQHQREMMRADYPVMMMRMCFHLELIIMTMITIIFMIRLMIMMMIIIIIMIDDDNTDDEHVSPPWVARMCTRNPGHLPPLHSQCTRNTWLSLYIIIIIIIKMMISIDSHNCHWFIMIRMKIFSVQILNALSWWLWL